MPAGDPFKITVKETESGRRLDLFVTSKLANLTRSSSASLVNRGKIEVSGYKKKASYKVKTGDVVTGVVPKIESILSSPEPEFIPIHILFEDNDLIVLNKPAGMVVHPSPGHSSKTLVNALLYHRPNIQFVGEESRSGIVHRLDKDTSGLILLAKNDRAHQWLQEEFRSRRVEKTYLALVDGAPPTKRGRVEAAIGRDPVDRKRMAVVPPDKGRFAVSEYVTETRYQQHTLLEVHPVTGRTHQIRLHMAFLGCPIVGDRIYGWRRPSLEIDRQFLHAARLSIRLPGESLPVEFEAPLPDDLTSVLDALNSA